MSGVEKSAQSGTTDADSEASSSDNFHDYALPVSSNEDDINSAELSSSVGYSSDHPSGPPAFPTENPELSYYLLSEVRQKVELFLCPRWKVILYPNAVHVVLLSAQDNISIQRDLVCWANGQVDLYVHCEPVSVDPFLKNVPLVVPLTSNKVNEFADRIVKILAELRKMEACSGCDNENYKSGWNSCTLGEIDKNPYKECRFAQTFRSLTCTRLVKRNAWRCLECANIESPLKRRANFENTKESHLLTSNMHLTEEQKFDKLNERKRNRDEFQRQSKHLRDKMKTVIDKQGVSIDKMLAGDLTEILNRHSISPSQSVFLQQQVKASQRKDRKGLRWHPTMIRLALSLHITSPAAFEMCRNTGMIQLPSGRTLFDYARIKPTEGGVDEVVLKSMAKKAKRFQHKHQKYYVLLADEIHLSQNFVFQKSTGRIVGYTSLDEVDKEVQSLEHVLNDVNEVEGDLSIAEKVLVYMAKGVTNGVREVVATYPAVNISANQMHFWTWEVINALEKSGIAIIALVTDGCSVSRAFIQLHRPVTKLPNDLVFDTVNKAAGNRVLYFISDVPNLLKSIRNCLLNSKSKREKGLRYMQRNGKYITWDYIVKLYETNKIRNPRKSSKLNTKNVFPDRYAMMQVRYAAEVLSRTVAQELEDQDWAEASELIFFIRFANDWFDCLNGAHASVGKGTDNANLLPYVSMDDSRFDFILSFVDYLKGWKDSAKKIASPTDNTGKSDLLQNSVAMDIGESSVIAQGGEDALKEINSASKQKLSSQTLKRVEMTSRAFVPMVKFLLSEGAEFINARVFTQDPLEQQCRKISASQGTNPNAGQVLTQIVYSTRFAH